MCKAVYQLYHDISAKKDCFGLIGRSKDRLFFLMEREVAKTDEQIEEQIACQDQ